MKLTYKFLLALFAILFLTMTSCKDDDPVIDEPEEEVITDLVFTLTPLSGDPVTLSFSDPDGDGGDPPIVATGTLAPNTTYTGTIEVKDESGTPTMNITSEIQEEDEDHQFFFALNGLNATITYDDMDANGNPIGLSSTLTTSDASNGTMTITLRHEPDKTASGVADGDATNAGGETDIEVTFNVIIQ